MVPATAELCHWTEQILNLKLQLGIPGYVTKSRGENCGFGLAFTIASPTFAC